MASDPFLEIKKTTIVALCGDPVLGGRLVLKGGNLLDIVFEISTRSSVDIDFSIPGDFEDMTDVRDRIERALISAFAELGLLVFDVTFAEKPKNLSPENRPFWGGYHVEFKLIGAEAAPPFAGDLERMRRNAVVVSAGDKRKFRIDISKHEYCGESEETRIAGHGVRHYSAEMALFEKLRAICQQLPEYLAVVHGAPAGRARDYVDIHTLAEQFAINFAAPDNHRLVARIFAAKRVPLKLIARVGDDEVRDFHRAGFEAVKSTLKPDFAVEEFDFYADYVASRCRDLKPLWDE